MRFHKDLPHAKYTFQFHLTGWENHPQKRRFVGHPSGFGVVLDFQIQRVRAKNEPEIREFIKLCRYIQTLSTFSAGPNIEEKSQKKGKNEHGEKKNDTSRIYQTIRYRETVPGASVRIALAEWIYMPEMWGETRIYIIEWEISMQTLQISGQCNCRNDHASYTCATDKMVFSNVFGHK